MGHGTTYDDRASDREERDSHACAVRTNAPPNPFCPLQIRLPPLDTPQCPHYKFLLLPIPTSLRRAPRPPSSWAHAAALPVFQRARRRTRSRMMYAVRRGGLEIREAREVVGPVEQGPPARKLFILNPRHYCLSFASEPAMAIAIIRPTHRREPCPGEHRRHTQGPGPAQARAIEAKLARVHLSSSQRRCSLPGMMHCRGYDASSGPPRACVCSLQSWIWTRGLGLARLGRTPDSQRAFSGVPLLDDSVPLRGPHHWCGTGAPTMRRR